MRNFSLKSGSALLITVLLMGLLMTLALGISNLVIREIGVTTSVVSANQAYYAAEAGVEEALLKLSENGPGYELPVQTVPDKTPLNSNSILKTAYNFTIDNRSVTVPDFPSDRPVFVQANQIQNSQGGLDFDCVLSSPKNELAVPKDPATNLYTDCPRATYKRLALHQTDIIPLYTVDANGQPSDVQDFMVEYYMNVASGDNFIGPFHGLSLNNFDVLRWKLYGKPKDQGAGASKTESIADIYPALDNNSPINPVCIGTDASLRSKGGENCIFPELNTSPSGAKEAGLWSAARECYMTDAGGFVTNYQAIKGTQGNSPDNSQVCSMKDFMVSHAQNYLVLTNLVNPNVVGITDTSNPEQLLRADIYYRILTPSDSGQKELARDYAEIVANGFSANDSVVKTLQVNYKKPGFLPVFNFSLYATSDQTTNPTNP